MFIGSRVEPEWRVEGESHSLTDAFCLISIVFCFAELHRLWGSGSTLGEHNGTF